MVQPRPTGVVLGRRVADRRDEAVSYIETFLGYLPEEDDSCIDALLDLHIAERALTPGTTIVDQQVELVQISADTQTTIDSRRLAREKLTGLQMHHFAAFYKGSWRANDWMWGRLDGAGWLVHILLDPRRLLTRRDELMDLNRTDHADTAAQLIENLKQLAGTPCPAEACSELAFLSLGPEDCVLPRSLPATARWVAAPIQRLIAGEELACVAAQVTKDREEGASTKQAQAFIDAYGQAVGTTDGASTNPAQVSYPTVPVEKAEPVLRACAISSETFHDEVGSNLLTRTLAQISGVTTAAVAGAKPMPTALKPAMATLRTATLTAYQVARETTAGERRWTTTTALAMLIGGALLATSSAPLLGGIALAVAMAGLVLLLITVTRDVVRIAAGLLAALVIAVALAGYLPVIRNWLFPRIAKNVVPYLHEHPAAWTIFFLLLLLPAAVSFMWLLGEVLRARRQRRTAPTPGP